MTKTGKPKSCVLALHRRTGVFWWVDQHNDRKGATYTPRTCHYRQFHVTRRPWGTVLSIEGYKDITYENFHKALPHIVKHWFEFILKDI